MTSVSALSQPHAVDIDHLQEILKPIREISAVWDIPLANYLTDFLDNIMNIDFGENFDPNVLNFSQAGLFLQGSTNVFAKKVKALYDMVLGSTNIESEGGDGSSTKRKSKAVDWTVNNVLIDIEDPKVCDNNNITEGKGFNSSTDNITTLPKIPFVLMNSLDNIVDANEENINGKFRVNMIPDDGFGVVLLDSSSDLEKLEKEIDVKSNEYEIEEGHLDDKKFEEEHLDDKKIEEEDGYEDNIPPPQMLENENNDDKEQKENENNEEQNHEEDKEVEHEENNDMDDNLQQNEIDNQQTKLPEMLNPDSNDLSFTIRPFQQFKKMPIPTSFDDKKKKKNPVKKPFHEDLFGEVFEIVKKYRKKKIEEEDRESIAMVVPEKTGREHVLDDIDTFVEMPPPSPVEDDGYVDLPQNNDFDELQPNEINNGRNSYEQMCKSFIVNMIQMGQSQVMLTEESKTLTKWENKLLPILELEKQRKSFNIEDVDNWIIDVISLHDNKYSFKALTEELDSYERSRVFMSLLILVNARKVVLENYTPGSENDDFNICLLKK